jgi:hypothetical protein
MLWSVFKFLMVPIGFQLAGLFPPATYAVLFATRVAVLHRERRRRRDRGLALRQAEAAGLGHRRGEQEVDRGTWACFARSLAICSGLVVANGLRPSGLRSCVAISISNTVFELFSPRGTDDFTMGRRTRRVMLRRSGRWIATERYRPSPREAHPVARICMRAA